MSEDDPSTVVASSRKTQAAEQAATGMALTILWHPALVRVGQSAPLREGGTLEISRRTPPFDAATDVFLSRAPFLGIRLRAGGAELSRLASAMPVEVAGQVLGESLWLTDADLRSGVILTLAGSVVICLHACQLPILRGPALGIVGGGDAIEAVRRQVSKVADLDVPVLIRGETGTGKELVARAIASGGPRAPAPFVAINMAAIPASTATDELFGHERGAFTGATEARPGYFVEADRGALFLDEVGASSSDVQAMLLRVLETGEIRALGARKPRTVDVRVIAATDENLEAAAAAGRFSEPLLHRLSGYQIMLPPLRDRRMDIGPLLLHSLRRELAAIGEADRLGPRDPTERPWLTAAEVARIASAPFPGNVRQLQNVARQIAISNRGQRFAELDEAVRAAIAGPASTRGAAAPAGKSSRPPKVTDEQIGEALRRHNYNYSAAADDLGIHRSTLYDRLRANPQETRNASELSDEEVLDAQARHGDDIAAMAAELRVSPKPLKARLTAALTRRQGSS